MIERKYLKKSFCKEHQKLLSGNMAEHYFMSVDGKKDFLVFNGDETLSDEAIKAEDIEFVEIKEIQEIKSMAWSSNCRWTFVIQQDCIYLINTYKDLAVRCKKKSSKFFEMFLNKKGVTK